MMWLHILCAFNILYVFYPGNCGNVPSGLFFKWVVQPPTILGRMFADVRFFMDGFANLVSFYSWSNSRTRSSDVSGVDCKKYPLMKRISAGGLDLVVVKRKNRSFRKRGFWRNTSPTWGRCTTYFSAFPSILTSKLTKTAST